jgi:GNAT superfamily N-acetyltransferase
VTAEPVLTVTDTVEPSARETIRQGLRAFNRTRSGVEDRRDIAVLVQDPETGETLGGLVGRTSRGMLFVEVFFLPEHLRGNGLGSRVLALAEEEARQRGCTTAVLITLSFQAPGFYEKLGYQAFGQIESRFFMRKALQ